MSLSNKPPQLVFLQVKLFGFPLPGATELSSKPVPSLKAFHSSLAHPPLPLCFLRPLIFSSTCLDCPSCSWACKTRRLLELLLSLCFSQGQPPANTHLRILPRWPSLGLWGHAFLPHGCHHAPLRALLKEREQGCPHLCNTHLKTSAVIKVLKSLHTCFIPALKQSNLQNDPVFLFLSPSFLNPKDRCSLRRILRNIMKEAN